MAISKITTESVLDGEITDAKITGVAATKLTGTVADARISASSVTQHVPVTDLSPVRSDILKLAIHQGIDGNRAAFNLEDSFIDTFEDDTGITTETDTDRNVSGEYVNSLSLVAIDTGKNIAPSSNDWDYTFDGGGEWPAAGNALGDHTSGGFVDNTGGDSTISSLITFDGDFEIAFTATGSNQGVYGVHAIDEDDVRAASSTFMHSMTNSYSWGEANIAGAPSYNYGGSNEATGATLTEPSDIVIARVSGVITISTDGGSTVDHTFATSYSGIMRFFIAGDGTPFGTDFDDILFTDTSKVQRDGFINETSGSAITIGDGTAGGRYTGALMRATSTGQVSAASIIINSAATPFTSHYEIWTHDGTNPAAQIGTDSATVNLSGAGTFRMTHSDGPALTKGQLFWLIIADDTGSGNVVADKLAGPFDQGGHTIGFGASDTITSIVDGEANDFAVEAEVTRTGEPTADHDTLLLIHSDTSDASTTFVDSSQSGRTITVVGDAQHDTAQKKFGATSMLFDGTGDYLTVPDSDDWNFSQYLAGTVDFWLRTGSTSVGVLNHATGDPVNNFDIYVNGSGKLQVLAGANGVANAFNITSTTSVNNSAWHHCAVVWTSGKGYLFINGTSEDPTTYTNYIGANISKTFQIGKANSVAGTMNGWIDEVRVSKVARWDANFTSPTLAYRDTPATTSGIGASGTLISDTQTASTSRTSASGVIIYEDGAGTSTLGTDLKIYFTANNGTNWTEASSYGTATTYSGTKKLVKLGSTTVTAGTQVAMKAVWANQSVSKEARLHGWAVNY